MDVYKSRILLVGHGGFLESSLQLLKNAGVVVYSFNMLTSTDTSYLIKHLSEVDAIVAMDYPQTANQIIGSKGLISISDIVDLCPNAKIIQFCGNLEKGSLHFGKIKYYPEKIVQNSINLNINELGERALVETSTACLNAASMFIKTFENSMNLNTSIVGYKVLNEIENVLLSKK